VIPVSPGQSGRGPNTVLKNEPSEELTFRGCPSLPDACKRLVGGEVAELCQVG
jgi:hypothetical protein